MARYSTLIQRVCPWKTFTAAPAAFMPPSAVAHVASGVLAVPADSAVAVADCLLVAGEASVVMFSAPDGDRDWGFVPDDSVVLTPANVEVSTGDLQRLRRKVAAHIEPERVVAARDALKATAHVVASAAGKNAHRPVSEALDAYAKNFLPQKITSPNEIERVRSEIALFIEFEGDLALADIDAERLRSFRDEKLSKVLAHENKVRLKYKTKTKSKSMAGSMAAVAGAGWPTMSAAERNLRMQWIGRMFKRLQEQKWILDNPATGLSGESVETKSERRITALKQKPRMPFSADDLQQIFSASWFKSGSGELTKKDTYRKFCPFRYWLPLLGVSTSCANYGLLTLREPTRARGMSTSTKTPRTRA